jgi:hypothetical protein
LGYFKDAVGNAEIVVVIHEVRILASQALLLVTIHTVRVI